MENKGYEAFKYLPVSRVSAVFVLLYTCPFLFVVHGSKTIHYSFPFLLNASCSAEMLIILALHWIMYKLAKFSYLKLKC